MSQSTPARPALPIRSGIAAVDRYLDTGYTSVPGMSSRFAAAICCGLLRMQSEMGIAGPVAEIGPFEGRFFIALAHALAAGETALGIDLFDWPNPEVIDRFEANCAKHGIAAERRITWKADSRTMAPEALLAKLGGRRAALRAHRRRAFARGADQGPGARHRRAGARGRDRARRHAAPGLPDADGGRARLSWHATRRCACCASSTARRWWPPPSSCSAARDWFKRYEEKLLEAYKDNVWPLGADFEPHWCLVLSLDTRLAAIE